MELLNDDSNPKPRFTPKTRYKSPTEEERLSELNNLDRDEVTEDFSDSPFLDK